MEVDGSSRVRSSRAKEEVNKGSKMDPQDLEELLAAARAVTRCVDIFCEVGQTIDVGLLLQQEESAQNGDLSEDESCTTARTKALSKMWVFFILCVRHSNALYANSTRSWEWHKRNYEALLRYVPSLRTLIGDPKKKDILHHAITEVSHCYLCTYIQSSLHFLHFLCIYALSDNALDE